MSQQSMRRWWKRMTAGQPKTRGPGAWFQGVLRVSVSDSVRNHPIMAYRCICCGRHQTCHRQARMSLGRTSNTESIICVCPHVVEFGDGVPATGAVSLYEDVFVSSTVRVHTWRNVAIDTATASHTCCEISTTGATSQTRQHFGVHYTLHLEQSTLLCLRPIRAQASKHVARALRCCPTVS